MSKEASKPANDPAGQPRTLFLLGVLLFAGFFLTSSISYLVSRDSIRTTILNDDLPLTSDNIYSEIQRDLFEPILISSLMANDTFLKDWIKQGEQDVPQLLRYLHQIQTKYGTVTSFLVSENTRNYYHAERVLKKVSEDNPVDAWFFRVRKMGKDYEINVDPDMANKDTMTIFINYRVTDRDGQFLGATGVGLTVDAVKTLMRNYHQRYHRDIFFYDRQGKLVLHSLGDRADTRRLPEHASRDAFQKILAELASGKSGITQSAVDEHGALVNYRYIPELDWILVVEQTTDGTAGILLKSFGWNFLICLGITVLFLSIIRITILRYQRNLESRNRQLQEKNAFIEEQAAELTKANTKLDAMHREKDEFIGITAHDLKNPLNSICGFSELLLLDESIRDSAREYVGHIHNSSYAMLEHVEDLLELTELEAPLRLELGPVDVRETVGRILNGIRAQAATKGISLVGDPGREPVFVQANEKALTAVIGNLLSNAIKYSPTGETVEVAIRVGDAEVEISVHDRGEGISAQEQEQLFQKFGRLSTRPTAGESSTGLGLYIVRQMTLRMGGRVWCTSRKGEGSLFTVALPKATAPAS